MPKPKADEIPKENDNSSKFINQIASTASYYSKSKEQHLKQEFDNLKEKLYFWQQ